MSEEYIIRPASVTDCMPVFNLSNDPVVRANSIHPEQITWDQHQRWFTQKIQDKNTLFYVIETSNKEFAGQVRFSKEKEGWFVSISLDKNYRNKHLGTQILQQAMKRSKLKKFIALIQKDNEASKRMFLKSNYQFLKTESINDKDYEVFCYEQ